MTKLSGEIQSAFKPLSLIAAGVALKHAGWDFDKMKAGLADTAVVEQRRFNEKAVVQLAQQFNESAEGVLFSFRAFYGANEDVIATDQYKSQFDQAIDLAAKYGGAIITITGYADPMLYLCQKYGCTKAGIAAKTPVEYEQTALSAKNRSLKRATVLRMALIAHAKKRGVAIDDSRIAAVGFGVACKEKACAPKNPQEQDTARYAEFLFRQVESETDIFAELD